MVQIIENWADVIGTVVEPTSQGTRPGHVGIGIAVEAVAPVEGYPNLLADRAGQRVDVQIRLEGQTELHVGQHIGLRVRLGAPGGPIFADPRTLRFD